MMSVLAIGETDSYAAWADGMMRTLPDAWSVDRTLVRFPTNPSDRQLHRMLGKAGAERWSTMSRGELRGRLKSRRDRIVFLACRGELVELISEDIRRHHPEALIVNGICGPAVPMSARAIGARLDVDVFIAHSMVERSAIGEQFRAHGARTRIGLATLPVLAGRRSDEKRQTDRGTKSRVARRVGYVDQEVTPTTRWDRVRLVQLLNRLAGDGVVVSRRTIAGEESTHRAIDRLDGLVSLMIDSGVVRTGQIVFDDRPVTEFLDDVDVVLTVSSTVGLEAIAAGRSVGFVTDFGVDDSLRNRVFEASGAQVALADLAGQVEVPQVQSGWAERNYFHPGSSNDWLELIADIAAQGTRSRRRSSVRVRTRLAANFPRAAAEVHTAVNRGART